MNWYKIAKRDFEYNEEIQSLWRDLLRDEMERSGISFDTENDDVVADKEIDMGNIGNHAKTVVYAELRSAGGDWQCPTYYFRCQEFYKHDEDSTFSIGIKFIVIPENNPNLSDPDDSGKAYPRDNAEFDCEYCDDKKIWKDLEVFAKGRLEGYYKQYLEYDGDTSFGETGTVRDLTSSYGREKTAASQKAMENGNHEEITDYPNFKQEQVTWSFGDYKRWVIDAYEISCRYTKTRELIVLTLNAWNWHNGIMVCEEFWKYGTDEESVARSDFDKLKHVVAETHKKFTDGDFEEAPNSIITRYLIVNTWDAIDRSRLAKTNIPHINYARQKAEYSTDWRSSIYGTRYPNNESTGF